jgi:plastocyanin
MYKKILAGIICIALLSISLAACSIVDASTLSTGPQVQMGGSTFLKTSITLKKGQTLTLVDTSSAAHIITNGTWQGGNAKHAQEAGAPTVNISFAGSDTHSTTAFTTAGTFKLYCTIHSGMNLTVIVQ